MILVVLPCDSGGGAEELGQPAEMVASAVERRRVPESRFHLLTEVLGGRAVRLGPVSAEADVIADLGVEGVLDADHLVGDPDHRQDLPARLDVVGLDSLEDLLGLLEPEGGGLRRRQLLNVDEVQLSGDEIAKTGVESLEHRNVPSLYGLTNLPQ